MTAKAIVKFTINPTVDNGYSIRTFYKTRKHVELLIYGKTTHDIFEISKNLKKEIMFHDDHIVTVSYKSCSGTLRQSKKLKNRLIRLFSKPYSENVKVTWKLIQEYIDAYGKAPDFSKFYVSKTRKKIKNYIEHVLNCEIDDETLNKLMVEREMYDN